MKKICSVTILIFTFFAGHTQYQNDNVLFRTVYLEDLCLQLKNNPGYILLDVRSKGEFEDTSVYSYLNIGHLKGAKHLDIRELPVRWRELLPYKDQPVFIYCSHSQRSRRASKLLSDSGFTHVFNINSGLTGLRMIEDKIACNQLLESDAPYQYFSPVEFCRVADKKNTILIDIRSDSARRGLSLNERENTPGFIRGSINIPLANLMTSLDKIPKNKQVILIDEYGNESPKAARMLVDKGFNKPGILFGGMEGWSTIDASKVTCRNDRTVQNVRYAVISPATFQSIYESGTNILLVDVRKADEFNNQAKETWRNIGNLKGARNIPADQMEQMISTLEPYKSSPVILYSFSGQPEVYQAAKKLADRGFTEVKVLDGGIFNLRWTAANVRDMSHLNEFVVNVPPPPK
ncbi:MAG TPA: rhodanese-like domain-containing protein [Flavitalea sp.]|nr:rhodanese-like domain-containing protein [Flavitalea sp.]